MTRPTGSVEDKSILVIGASSGIGAAITLELAGAGARVAAGARRRDRLSALVEQANGLSGEVAPLELDVTDEASIRSGVRWVVERFGRLDVLINNAGVMLSGPILEADTTEWTRMISTNLLGTMLATHAALPYLIDSNGTIVQTSSTSGRVASAGGGVYAATKHGVNAFSESLRQEVTGKGVRVVLIEPGFVETELTSHIADPETRAMAAHLASSMRVLQPHDVAAAVHFAIAQPEHVAVNEILLRPTDQVR
ncbi:SDR family NAD(P)-dependent oxidoreductase [Nocardia sp. NPDC049220]|uniref:SDR family NAD(P)-dependent oxidoreductase n=1 Tax=Nocardia sp. NPDC049220 TaxID=3155273 RepID=UPI0033CE0822